MQASSVSNSTNAYCKLSPVFQSLMTSHFFIFPNREKINSKDSLSVSGLSLQTKRTVSGGLVSTEGKSPKISNVLAALSASLFRLPSLLDVASSDELATLSLYSNLLGTCSVGGYLMDILVMLGEQF